MMLESLLSFPKARSAALLIPAKQCGCFGNSTVGVRVRKQQHGPDTQLARVPVDAVSRNAMLRRWEGEGQNFNRAA